MMIVHACFEKLLSIPSPIRLSPVLLMCLATVSVPSVHAQDNGSDFKLTGFVSLVGGKVMQGDINGTPIAGANCPCYTADWGNAGVYRDQFSLKQESRAGIQLNYKPTPDLSLVSQIVVRGTDTTPNIQWAYGGYKIDKHWEVQLGRKRIPLYYYSDFQDIGLSYPWVSPPPELYGWEATNYNGASLRYNNNFGDTNLSASIFAGSEKVKDPLYLSLYFPNKSEVSWKSIVGADMEVNSGPLTVRGVYMQADVRTQVFDFSQDDTAKLSAYGLAVNLDLDKWFVLSEVTQLRRNFIGAAYSYKAPAFTLGAGVHLGEWTPFLNYAEYTEKTSDQSKYAPQSYKRLSFTLKYDLDASSAVKAQVDRHTDTTKNFGGDATVLRVSYDRVF